MEKTKKEKATKKEQRVPPLVLSFGHIKLEMSPCVHMSKRAEQRREGNIKKVIGYKYFALLTHGIKSSCTRNSFLYNGDNHSILFYCIDYYFIMTPLTY